MPVHLPSFRRVPPDCVRSWRRRGEFLLVFAALAIATPAPAAQEAPAPSAAAAIDGPPPPVPPATIARDADGRATVRAVRVPGLTLDGRLDEAIYATVPPVGDFVQQEPDEGEAVTEATETWVLFDELHLYVALRCHQADPDRLVANELRRDSDNIARNDNVAVILDTFHDRRNGFLFQTNPLGGLFDALVTDERETNSDWNTVWSVRTARFDGGWTVEMAIPFKSLRYRSSGPQTWGINVRRIIRWRNESSFVTPVARAWGENGLLKVSLAATLVGLEIGQRSRIFEVKPYAIGGLTTNREVAPPRENDWTGDVGGDLKLGVTQGLTLDVTVNTDFAQVENDEQQINLTRFDLFFPEKREFFLEGQGIFSFGGPTDERRSETPILFFSRRIGLYEGQTVPIVAGVRLTGRAGAHTIGALSIRQGEAPDGSLGPTTFSVGRLKRDVGRRSSVGAMVLHRSRSLSGDGDNLAYGADASLWLAPALIASGYYARTENADSTSGTSYQARLQYNGDRVEGSLEHLSVDPTFEPEIGFVRRTDLRRTYGRVRFQMRPSNRSIRWINLNPQLLYATDSAGRLQDREAALFGQIAFENGDRFFTRYGRLFERVDEGFRLANTVDIPAGDYRSDVVAFNYDFGPQRRASGMVTVRVGTFYGGDKVDLDGSGRVEITPRASAEPRLVIAWIDLPARAFRTTLAALRVNYSFTPRTLLSALLQYNSTSDSFDSNVRFRWEFQPGSDLFVVYSDSRDTELVPSLQSRSFVVKVSKLLRF